MRRTLWISFVLGLLLLAAVVIAVVHVAGERAKAVRLASYRYSVEDGGGRPELSEAYVESPALEPHVAAPRAIAVDRADRILVAGAAHYVVLDPDGRELRRVALPSPASCVATDDAGHVYIGHEKDVSVFDPDGSPRGRWTPLGEMARLTSLAVEGERVFVADAGQRTVWVLDVEGRLTGRITGRGFRVPGPYFDVVADPDGVWIVNPGALTVERYSNAGEFRSAWGRSGMGWDGFCGCCNPIHLARTPAGHFVTAEKGLARIKVMDADGELRAVVADRMAFAGGDLAANEPAHIADLAVDSAGRVLVLERGTGRIRVFVPNRKPAAGPVATHSGGR